MERRLEKQDRLMPAMAEMRDHATEAAAFLKALANDQRLLVLCALLEGPLSVGDINERVPLSQSALSQHLSVLRDAGSSLRPANRKRFTTRSLPARRCKSWRCCMQPSARRQSRQPVPGRPAVNRPSVPASIDAKAWGTTSLEDIIGRCSPWFRACVRRAASWRPDTPSPPAPAAPWPCRDPRWS